MNNAEIIGIDYKTCPCCGGNEIVIDGVTNPNNNPYFLVGQFPPNFFLENNIQFPVAVRINWKRDTAYF